MPSPRSTITREFDAPVALVFRAYTEPELFRQWIGPRNRTFELQEFDCRTGGAWRYSTVDEDFEAKFYGAFHEVRDRRADRADLHVRGRPDQVALETADLRGPRRRPLAGHLGVARRAPSRSATRSSPAAMETGVVEGYEKLDELLATLG